jgi:hypothetical protein
MGSSGSSGEHSGILIHLSPEKRFSYRIFGHPRLLLRGQAGARIELSLAVMAYNLKRMATYSGLPT